MKDISIDIETLSTSQNATILSIGACYFDRLSGTIGQEFYCNVELENQNRHLDIDTLKWWIGQEANAAKVLFKEEIPLNVALASLREFCTFEDEIKVWGNGATFDISILENAYHCFEDSTPWPHWAPRDMRTVVDLASYSANRLTFDGQPHNALDDAKHQAKVIAHCIAQLTNNGVPF